MKLKTTEINGAVYAEVQDGKPVYEAEDGKPVAFDAPYTNATIKRLNAEAKANRERYEAAEHNLKAFEGLDDPDRARKALETLKNLDDKKLIDAGQVEKVKQEAEAAFNDRLKATEMKYRPVLDERDSLKSQLFHERLSVAFAHSPYVAKALKGLPPDMAQAKFGSHFGMNEEGTRMVAKDAAGNVIYSRERAGEIAEFDEAMESIVAAYPYRDQILAGTGASGGGAGSSRTDGNGRRTITRAQFGAMSPADQMKTMKEGKTVVVD